MTQIKYTKQWLYLKKNRTLSQTYAQVLQLFPTNTFQLNFWCDLMFMAKIRKKDTPEQAIFYLYDRSYEKILNNLSQNCKASFIYKIQLLQLILGMSVNSGFSSLRQGIEECVIISETYTQKNPRIDQYQSLKKQRVQVLSQHLCKKTAFTIQFMDEQIADFFVRESIFDYATKKKLHQFDDLSMVNIFTNHLDNFRQIWKTQKSNSQKKFITNLIKQFLIKNKKSNVIASMKDHLFREACEQHVQFIMEVAYKLDIVEELFVYTSAISKMSMKNNLTDSQILYKIYSDQLNGSSFKNMKYFQKFMLKQLACKPLTLFSVLKSDSSHIANLSVLELLNSQNLSILQIIQQSPLKTAKLCLEYYLTKSNFKNPYSNRLLSIKSTNQHHNPLLLTCKQIIDPFLFLPIYQSFWNHSFHKEILNRVLWITIENWLLYVQANASQKEEIQVGLMEEYRKNIRLTFFQFMCSCGLGVFVQYYPIQIGIIFDIVYMPSFSELMLGIQNFTSILWLNHAVNSEIKTIIKQKRGIQFIYEYVRSKKNSLQGTLAEFLASLIEVEIKKNQEKGRKHLNPYLVKIMEELSQSWKFDKLLVPVKANYLKLISEQA